MKDPITKIMLYDMIIVSICSLLWTGLPIYFFNLTGSYLYVGSTYLIGGISSILSSFLGRLLFTKCSKKYFSGYLIFLITINLALWYSLYFQKYYTTFAFLLLMQLICGSFAFVLDSAFSVMINKAIHAEVVRRNTLLLSAKLISFCLGPLFFSLFQVYSFLMFAGVAALLLVFNVLDNTMNEVPYIKNKSIKANLPMRLSAILLVDGMIFPVILNFSFIILKKNFLLHDWLGISLFWSVLGVSILGANWIIKKTAYHKLKASLGLLTLLFSVGLTIMILAKDSVLFFIGFAVTSTSHAFFLVILRSELLLKFAPEVRSSALMWASVINNVGTIALITLFLAILTYFQWINVSYLLSVSLILVLSRSMLITRYLEEEVT